MSTLVLHIPMGLNKVSQVEKTAAEMMYNQKAISPRSPPLNHFKMPDRRIRPQQNKDLEILRLFSVIPLCQYLR